MSLKSESWRCRVGLTAWLGLFAASAIAATPVPRQDDEEPARLLYVVRDGDRFIASNILLSRTDEFRLSAREEVSEQLMDNAVAVVGTNRRVIAYSVYTASWVPVPLKAGEEIEHLEAEDFSAFALTSRRIMNFNGRIGYWSETRRKTQ